MTRTRFALVFFAAVFLGMSLAVSAAAPDGHSARIQKPRPSTELLIGLPVPSPADFRDGALPRDAGPRALAHAVARTTAAPILQQLDELRRMGRVRGYEIDAAQFAVRVELDADADPAAVLGMIDGATYVGLPHAAGLAGTEQADCAVSTQQAAMNATRVAQMNEQRVATAHNRSTDATLYVTVSVTPGSTWSSAWGWAGEDVEVTMRIRRAGRLMIEESTFSYSDGFYEFYPNYERCPDGYNWRIIPGDVVEIISEGETISTVVMEIQAQLDAANKVLWGTVRGNTVLAVDTSTYWDAPTDEFCYDSAEFEQVHPDGDGAFQLDLTAHATLNNSAYSWLTALDPDSGATERYVNAFRLTVDRDFDEFWGTLPPNASYSAELRRGGSVVATDDGYTSYDGYFYGWFNADMQTGDVVVASARGVEQQFTVVDQDLEIDVDANSLVGITGPNHSIQAYFYNDPDRAVNSGCEWNYDCAKGQAAGNGQVAIDSDLDLRRGDYARVMISDTAGNSQYISYLNSPAIQAEVGTDYARGLFTRRQADLTIRLLNSSEVLKSEYLSYAQYDGYFYAYFSETIAPGDIITVTDGVSEQRMTVQDVDGRLNSNTDRLTVSGPDGQLVIDGYAGDGFECTETTLRSSGYVQDFDYVGPGNYAYATLVGPDGNYTNRYLTAFWLDVEMGRYNGLYGSTELGNQSVQIDRIQEGNVIDSQTVQSEGDGFFYASFADIGDVDWFAITAGDITANVDVPPLTAALDVAANATVGQAFGNSWVQARLLRSTPWGYDSVSQGLYTDAGGNYAASWDDWFWYNDCSDIEAGNRCSSAAVSYYDGAGYGFYYTAPPPPPAPADQFEDDNTPAQAKDYQTASRTHTFHDVDDVDWVKFTVPAGAVGRTYRLATINMGWDLYPAMTLYAADGQTEIANGWVQFEWQPESAGTYLLKVETGTSYLSSSCDAFYDLVITSQQNYLPSITR